jgi:hypothetical protein
MKKGMILDFAGKPVPFKIFIESDKIEFSSNLQESTIPFTLKHFRVIANGKLVEVLCPNLPYARRMAADVIRNGGTATIVEAVEVWIDKGATFEQLPLGEWL